MTAVLDACAFIQVAYPDGPLKRQAALTYAMGRHVAVDLAFILGTEPIEPKADRLPLPDAAALIEELEGAGSWCGADCGHRLVGLRSNYEPYLNGLAQFLLSDMPPWTPVAGLSDSWQTTAWDHEKHF